MDIAYIYSITNLKTGAVYVGSTVNIPRRRYKHFRALRTQEHTNGYLQRSYNKHGPLVFAFHVIRVCPAAIRYQEEKAEALKHIKLFNLDLSFSPGRAIKHTDESKQKMALAHMKPVINLTTGETFPSHTAAAASRRISKHRIGDCIHGRIKTAGGCRWSYKLDEGNVENG